MKKLFDLTVNLTLLVVSLAVGFLIIELLFRMFLPAFNLQPNKGIATADERGHTIWQKNFDGYILSHEANRDIHAVTNTEGFIGPDYSVEKTQDTIRLAFLGDSFVESFQVDYEDTFTFLIDQELDGSFDSLNFEVMNFGVGGQGTMEQLLRHHYYVAKYKPDVVAVFFVPNDFENNQYYLDQRDLIINHDPSWIDIEQSDANFKQERTDLKYKILKTFRSVQYIDKLVRRNALLSKIAIKVGLHDAGVLGTSQDGIHPGFFIFEESLNKNTSQVFDFTAELIKFFRDQAVSNGSKFVLVYVPQAEQVDGSLWQRINQDIPSLADYEWNLDHPNTFLGNLADQEGFGYLDLTPFLRDFYQQNPDQYLYNISGIKYHNGHFSELGHSLVTQILEDYFIEYLELN